MRFRVLARGAAKWQRTGAALQQSSDADHYCSATARKFGTNSLRQAIVAHNWMLSLDLLARMPAPSFKEVAAVITVCGKARQWRAAQRLLATRVTASSKEGRSTGEQEGAATVPVVVWNAMIGALGNCAQWQHAVRVLRGIADGVADHISYNSTISACAKCGQWEMALRVLAEMRESSVSPDVISFSSAIAACEKGSQWQGALRILRMMQKSAVAPNVVTYSACITACAKGVQWERALKLFATMIEKGNIEPNVVTYSAAISACASGAKWKQAVLLLHDMHVRAITPNVISYSAAINACESAHNWQTALALFRDMTQRDIAPNQIAYSSTISACGKGAMWEHALQLFDAMQRSGVSCAPDMTTYNAVIDACVNGGQWERALALASQVPAIDDVTRTTVINALHATMQWQRALTVFHAMHAPDHMAYAAIVAVLHDAERIPDVIALYRRAERDGVCNHASLSVRGGLDFHHFPLPLAQAALRSVLEGRRERWTKNKNNSQETDLVIVVGRGVHTTGDGVPRLKEGIRQLCVRGFVPSLDARDEPTNAGRLRVVGASIGRWIKCGTQRPTW